MNRDVLIIAHVPADFANTVHDHLNALKSLDNSNVAVFDSVADRTCHPDLNQFDVIILHYSLICFSESYIAPDLRQALRRFSGLKVLFIQDEYRQINDANDAMIDIHIDVLFTCVPKAMIPRIYGRLIGRGVRIVPTLTGYVPDQLIGLPRRPVADRELDIVYRGRSLPPTLGALSMEKKSIADQVRRHAPRYGLKADASWKEDDRIYGDAWNSFLSSGRTALGTESGASICDFDGSLDEAWTRNSTSAKSITSDEYYARFLAQHEGNGVINTISPRTFEAIALGTPLVQFPGEYSGVLEAGRHYVSLNKDFSNFSDVAGKIRDTKFLQTMADLAYDEVIASGAYSYSEFAKSVGVIIDEECRNRCVIFDNASQVVRKTANTHLAPLADRVATEIEHKRGLSDYALANSGTSISSNVAFFSKPNDLDYLGREEADGGYAAALDGQSTPQWIEFIFNAVIRIDRIDISFFGPENIPKCLDIEIAPPESGFEKLCNGKNLAVKWSVPAAFVAATAVRLTAAEFQGQQRLLIRRIKIWGKYHGEKPAEQTEPTALVERDEDCNTIEILSAVDRSEPRGLWKFWSRQ